MNSDRDIISFSFARSAIMLLWGIFLHHIKLDSCNFPSVLEASSAFRVPTGSEKPGKHGKWLKKKSMRGKIMEFEN